MTYFASDLCELCSSSMECVVVNELTRLTVCCLGGRQRELQGMCLSSEYHSVSLTPFNTRSSAIARVAA